jgi:hypothetical protein
MNKSLKHVPFHDVFEKMLKGKPLEEFESFILEKCQNIHHFMNTTFSTIKRIPEMIDFFFGVDPLHDLFDTNY